MFTSNDEMEDVASFIKNTRIRKAGLHLKSDKPEDVQAWVDNYPDEARMLAQEMVDAMVERGILKKVQPATGQSAGGVRKNSPVLQTVPVSLPGAVGSEPEPTPEPGGEGKNPDDVHPWLVPNLAQERFNNIVSDSNKSAIEKFILLFEDPQLQSLLPEQNGQDRLNWIMIFTRSGISGVPAGTLNFSDLMYEELGGDTGLPEQYRDQIFYDDLWGKRCKYATIRSFFICCCAI